MQALLRIDLQPRLRRLVALGYIAADREKCRNVNDNLICVDSVCTTGKTRKALLEDAEDNGVGRSAADRAGQEQLRHAPRSGRPLGAPSLCIAPKLNCHSNLAGRGVAKPARLPSASGQRSDLGRYSKARGRLMRMRR